MNAHNGIEHIVYMPSAMSHRNVPAVSAPTGTSRPSGLEAAFVRAVRYIAAIPSRHAVKRELSLLTDRELADIGLTRAEISHVFTRHH